MTNDNLLLYTTTITTAIAVIHNWCRRDCHAEVYWRHPTSCGSRQSCCGLTQTTMTSLLLRLLLSMSHQLMRQRDAERGRHQHGTGNSCSVVGSASCPNHQLNVNAITYLILQFIRDIGNNCSADVVTQRPARNAKLL